MPTREDVLRAMERIDTEGLPDGFGPSVYYDLIHPDSGKIYPPKAVWALASGSLQNNFYPRFANKQLQNLGFKVLDRRRDSPVADIFDETAVSKGVDGAMKQVTSNQYERDPKLRRACVEYFVRQDSQLKCQVCDLDFSQRYGEIGRGFIHIHHVDPLGDGQGERAVDPVRDLVPVCPNCHAMLHKKPGKGAYTVKELKKMMKQQRANPEA